MATLTSAAQRTATKKFKGKYPGPDKYKGKKPYKGKYPGPDKYKGNPPPKTPTAAPTAAPDPAAMDATAAGQSSAPVGSNSTGTLGLQTNLDIENQMIDAEVERKRAEEQAALIRQNAALAFKTGLENARKLYQSEKGNTNANTAFRGMRGTAAINASEDVTRNLQERYNALSGSQQGAENTANTGVLDAESSYNATLAKLAQARQAYTNQQSAENPTAGTTPISSGLSAIKPTATPKAPATNAAATVNNKSKTYKGKYPGPDKFKGNAKKLAAYRAAKRKVGSK